MPKPVFPVTAIVGQSRLKLALQLVLVDERIGGLLISGPRGSAKSTLVRSIGSLMAEMPLVTLPLGASEDKITGSVHLEKALAEQRVEFSPGLLAKAHGGLLYVDEVNLLADHLVDLLLDVAASGVNLVERDGISHQHDAAFSLIGTMNPDEGDLRPQLLDRFGLMATVETRFSIEQRQAIVQARLAYDDDPQGFVEQHEAAMQTMATDICWARENRASVEMPVETSEYIARLCYEHQVDGMRADITLHRAACSHAALQRKSRADNHDVDAVVDLVLNHRSNADQDNDSGSSGPADGSSESPTGSTQGDSSIGGSWQTSSSNHQGIEGQSQRQWVNTEHVPTQLLDLRSSNSVYRQITKSQDIHSYSRDRNRGQASARQTVASGSGSQRVIDWFGTLTSNVDLGGSHLTAKWRYPAKKNQWLNLIMLDTSASTVGQRGLARAKGAVAELAYKCYLRRESFNLVTFGNQEVAARLQTRRAPKRIDKCLADIHAGGGTPLASAVEYAAAMAKRLGKEGRQLRLFFFTDGRARLSDASVLPLRHFEHGYLVDTEMSSVPLGLAKRLAEQLSLNYCRIDSVADNRF